MADTIPGRQAINVGVQNQATGSDDLYTAFTKVETNFENLFANASPYVNVSGGTGILVTNPNERSLAITNTGVTKLNPGTGITLNNSNGNVTISVSGTLTGVVAGVTNVGIRSTTLNISGSPIISNGNIVVELPAITPSASFNPGTYVSPTVTVDQYGRIVEISSISTAGTVTSIAVTAGEGISVSGSPIIDSGTISVTNTGVTRLTAGTGISLSGSTGAITISGVNQNIGTVTRIDVSSNTLTVTGSPITSSGTLNIELRDDPTFTKITSANIVSTGPISADANISTTGNIVATGNVSGNNFTINGNLTVLGTTVTVNNEVVNQTETITGNLTAGNISTGNLSVTSNVTVTGNIGGNNLSIANFANVTGNLKSGNADLGNLATSNYFSGNGSLLSSVTGANVTGTVSAATTAGTVTTASQSNITSLGTLTDLSVSGNTSINILKSTNANGNIMAGTANIISLSTGTYTMFGSQYTVGNIYVGGSTFGLPAFPGYVVQSLGMPAGTPVDGTFAIDSANNQIGVYYGGSWHYATLTP